MNVLVAGDFCPQSRVAELFANQDFETVLCEISPFIKQVDYSILNFECPVCEGDEKPIEKCGPNLKCSIKGLEAIKWAGFNCVTLANNHFLDYGAKGVENTLSACSSLGISTVGGGGDLEQASQTLYLSLCGKKLAIINCCEHEFSIATETSAGSNPLNPIQQYYAIKEARNQSDYVLVIVHGGHEYYQLPSLRMQETYRFFVEAGADAVVNHHQHCYSGYETYKGKPIFYGLGNFCFDGNLGGGNEWYEGYMVVLTFDEEISYKILPYTQGAYGVGIKMTKPDSFDDTLERLNNIINNPDRLKEEQNKYYESVIQSSKNVLNPVVNRYLSFLQSHHLLPSIVSKKWVSIIHNHIMCEAHRDRLLYYLNNK